MAQAAPRKLEGHGQTTNRSLQAMKTPAPSICRDQN